MLKIVPEQRVIALDCTPYRAAGGELRIQLADGRRDLANAQVTPGPGGAVKACWDGGLELVMEHAGDGALGGELRNAGREPVQVAAVAIEFAAQTFDRPPQARRHRQLVHGREFGHLSGVKQVHCPAEWIEVAPECGMVTVYADPQAGEALLIGALPPFGAGFTVLRTLHSDRHMEGAFGVGIEMDVRCVLNPGQTLRLAPIVALGGRDGTQLLAQYAELMRRRLSRPFKPPVTGWNSWDYYAGAVQRADMDESIQACGNVFGDRLRYMVIDEGYERQWGVWDAGWKFPEGLKDFCQHARSRGFEPGIWTAPTTMSVYTPLSRQRPDLFARNAAGDIHTRTLSYGAMAQLDVTHPDAREYLRQTYTRLREYGFTYFKCDFTQLLLEAERFHRPNVGRAELIRSLFALIREAIGPESYLLACGAPFESVIGLADAVRTTADIHDYWTHAVQNARAGLARWWMQGAAGNVDADFVIVRCPQTTDDPGRSRAMPVIPRELGLHWCDGAQMNLEEAKVIALLAYLSGGDIVLGDAIGKLNEAGLRVLERVLPPLGVAARPVNLFDPAGMRTPVLLARQGDEALLACINLTDDDHPHPHGAGLLNQAIEGREFWSGERTILDPARSETLPARSARAYWVPASAVGERSGESVWG